jgi:hypothetical protein
MAVGASSSLCRLTFFLFISDAQNATASRRRRAGRATLELGEDVHWQESDIARMIQVDSLRVNRDCHGGSSSEGEETPSQPGLSLSDSIMPVMPGQ